MANHFSHASLPYPIRNARYTLLVPYLASDGTPTDPTTPDTEVSKDAGSFADCAEEVSTITGSNGEGYITLTGAETDCVMLGLAAKVASGPKATLATLYPRTLAVVGSGTLSAGSAGGGTLGTLLAYDVTGCFIRTTGGTGGGGTGGANNQARKIITYNRSTGAFTVSPNWETTPDNTTTYDVLLPEGVTLGMLKALNPATAGRDVVVDSAGLVDATCVKLGPSGSATAQTARDVGNALPSAAPAASGGLFTRGTGAGQINQDANGRIDVNVTAFGGSAGTFASGRPEVKTDSLGTTAKSDVNAEVVDVMGVDTITEQAQGAPPAAPTTRQLLSYLYMLFIRNKKTVDASASPAVESVLANDDSTVVFKRNISDSANVTTFSKSVSG